MAGEKRRSPTKQWDDVATKNIGAVGNLKPGNPAGGPFA